MATEKRSPRETGPIATRLAANVRTLREARRFNQPQLAARLKKFGAPLHATAVSKIETQERRVDVDDLVALAVALDTTPNRLLLTEGAASGAGVDLTPVVTVSELDAWRWASGEQPLPSEGCEDHAATRQLRFMAESMPHHNGADRARRRREISALLERDGELARIVAVVVDEAARRGLDHGTLLEVVSHMHVQSRFDLSHAESIRRNDAPRAPKPGEDT